MPEIHAGPGALAQTVPGSTAVAELAPQPDPTIVSSDKGKDYVLSPQRYDELGTRELVLYDPEFEQRRDGRRFQVFRCLKGRGLSQVEVTNADRGRSKVLGCYLREVPAGRSVRLRLRLGVGKGGDEMFLTALEVERAATEAERAARQQAEARVAALEARLKALDGKRRPKR
jgi:hypothetical protein